MHLASASFRRSIAFVAFALVMGPVAARAADRGPLVGTTPSAPVTRPTWSAATGQIVPIDTTLFHCIETVTFSDVEGGETPGTNYDGVLASGGLLFAERFAGQSVSSSGFFDAVAGAPTDPLTPQAGEPGQNLDVFDYAGNVLAGLGALGYPDVDAIGEGAIAISFPVVQAEVKLSIFGGNGGSATLTFYRQDGSVIDEVVVATLGDQAYGFGTFDGSYVIRGILIQNSDTSGLGVDDICYDPAPTIARPVSWGILKQLYR